MAALVDTPVPVPRMIHLEEGSNPLGRDFYVMEHLDGRIFWDPALPDVADRGPIYDAMNDVLVALARVDPAAVGLADFGRAEGFYDRQVALWTRQYHASVAEPDPAMVDLGDWLAAQDVAAAPLRAGARRFSHRQHDVPPDGASRHRTAGLGTLDAGPSDGRHRLSMHAVAPAARRAAAGARRARPGRRIAGGGGIRRPGGRTAAASPSPTGPRGPCSRPTGSPQSSRAWARGRRRETRRTRSRGGPTARWCRSWSRWGCGCGARRGSPAGRSGDASVPSRPRPSAPSTRWCRSEASSRRSARRRRNGRSP